MVIQTLNGESLVTETLSKPNLRTYRTFKFDCKVESYLSRYIQKYERSLLCQFRIGILPLNIETGRFKNIRDSVTGRFRKSRPEERTCDLCELNVTEDEYHFLIECPVYNLERQILYDKFQQKYPDFINLDLRAKFTFLMNNGCNELCKYLKNSWNKRKTLLYN